eukprot:1158818-Pelagomonas_calceolata.AAC.6
MLHTQERRAPALLHDDKRHTHSYGWAPAVMTEHSADTQMQRFTLSRSLLSQGAALTEVIVNELAVLVHSHIAPACRQQLQTTCIHNNAILSQTRCPCLWVMGTKSKPETFNNDNVMELCMQIEVQKRCVGLLVHVR